MRVSIGPARRALGWAWRGGWLGALIVAMILLSAPLSENTIRQQRRVWERLLRLQDRTQTLATALEAERDRAELASAARTRFFAAAGHDLRQPLHALSVNAITLRLLARRAADASFALGVSSGMP